MKQSENQLPSLPRGLKYSLHFLSIIAVPFILIGVIGAVLLAATSIFILDFGDYQRYFIFLGVVVLFFATGRSILLIAEFIRKNHTQVISENLVLKYSLLVLKEVTFMIAYILGVATVVSVGCILLGFERDYSLFLTFFTVPAIIAIYLNSRITEKMKCFEDVPLAF